MGGEKDGLGLHIEGTAHFERGEEVVVFLNERNPDGSFDIHGMMMGKLNLEKNSDGEEILKGPALWIARSATSFDSTPQKQWTLESLKNLIQEQATPPSPRPEGPPTPQFTQPASRHTSSLPTPDLPTPQAASPLQHTPEERGFTWLSGWVGILGLGLLGTLARLWRKRRRGASH
jgi:hypothetical protein